MFSDFLDDLGGRVLPGDSISVIIGGWVYRFLEGSMLSDEVGVFRFDDNVGVPGADVFFRLRAIQHLDSPNYNHSIQDFITDGDRWVCAKFEGNWHDSEFCDGRGVATNRLMLVPKLEHVRWAIRELLAGRGNG